MPPLHTLLCCLVCCLPGLMASAQGGGAEERAAPAPTVRLLSLEPAPTFDKKRFWVSASVGFGIYAGASYAMWDAWYKDFPLGGFHTFNDMKEWKGMDKAGHFQAAYVQSNYTFHGARWTGMSRRKAMWTGVGVATGIQATIEIMDGFSEEWGFSVGDIAFNTLGTALFASQEMIWREQRILLKVSSTQPDYPATPIYSVDGAYETTLQARARELYGESPSEIFLKDYNAMTIWASFNVKAFRGRKNGRFPAWLNVAFCLGANNIYGGFSNRWRNEEGGEFVLSSQTYPRHHQFYLAPDVDFSRIPTRHRWLKLVLCALNWVKVPSPVVSFDSQNGLEFQPFYW